MTTKVRHLGRPFAPVLEQESDAESDEIGHPTFSLGERASNYISLFHSSFARIICKLKFRHVFVLDLSRDDWFIFVLLCMQL